MPSLADFLDTGDLDNAFSDKVIVYVEGPDDEIFFRNLAGPNIQDRLEFKTPEEATGYHEVKKRVAQLRSQSPQNKRIHGLLDGEAAAALGLVGQFLDNQDTLFEVAIDGTDGLLFLAEYELENLIVSHARVAEFITKNVAIKDIGSRDVADVQKVIEGYAKRFLLFTFIKFTMGEFHRADRTCKGVDRIAGRFLDAKAGPLEIIHKDAKALIEGQIDWDEFLEALRTLARSFLDRSKQLGLDRAAQMREVLRVSDGKLLLKQIKNKYGGDQKWDGHLHDDLVQSPYCERFRSALLTATAGRAGQAQAA